MGMVFTLILTLVECEQSAVASQLQLEACLVASDWFESGESSLLASAAPLAGPGTENGT
jgi:hypothetical protein